MLPARPERQPTRAAPFLLVLAALAACTAPARADVDAPAGIIIPVHSARMWEEAHRFELAVKKPLRRFEAARGLDPARKERFTVICDFNPDGQAGASDNYEACLKLAEALRNLESKHGVRTVAWVHGDVSRHTVLPVLACEERVFSSDTTTRFGKVIGTGDAPLRKGQMEEYEGIAGGRFDWGAVFIRKMYDRQLVVVKVNRGGKEKPYREKRADEELRLDEKLVEGLGAGDTAAYSFDQAERYGLCQKKPVNPGPGTGDAVYAELRLDYDLPASAVVRQSEQPVVCRIVLTGEVSGGLKERFQRRLDRAREMSEKEGKPLIIILQIGCGDGDLHKAADMARAVLKVSDRTAARPAETIAYVTKDARSTATLIALACDRIVMHPKAELGNFERFLGARADDKKDDDGHANTAAGARDLLAEIAARQGFPTALARAFATRDAHVHWVESIKGKTDTTFIDYAEFTADQARDPKERRWNSKQGGELRTPQGGYLTLTGDAALEFGVIDKVAEDWDGTCELAGVKKEDVHLVSNDMLDQIADFLREPVTQGILIMLAITCLILELKMPGTAIPGIISGVCFVLFFWSQAQFDNEMTTLSILLFILGLVLIALEVFVIPGFGVTGISGILLVIASLGLMAYGHWPRTTEDWGGMGKTLAPIGMSMGAAVCLAFLLARYLPHIPGANRLFLKPEGQTEEGEDIPPVASAGPDLSPLLGVIGVAVSPLRPAGKMQIGDDFVDVVAEGGYIAPGTRVQVIEIEGNRVVVKEV
jgi:membrane-bound ClpP family serine protease